MAHVSPVIISQKGKIFNTWHDVNEQAAWVDYHNPYNTIYILPDNDEVYSATGEALPLEATEDDSCELTYAGSSGWYKRSFRFKQGTWVNVADTAPWQMFT